MKKNKLNEEKESTIYPSFPIWSLPLGYKVVDEGKYLFRKVFLLINTKKKIRISPFCILQ